MTKCVWVAAVLVALLAACGGSGSTGLVSPEGALLREVRRDGTCVTAEEMVTYCATDSPDAVSPDGASASGPFDAGASAPTSTPGGAAATPSAQPTGTSGTPSVHATASPAPEASATPSVQATPCQAGACPAPVELRFVVRGLPDGAACALAARAAGTTSAWSTGPLVAAGGATTTIEPALPGDVGPGLVEIALLCFEEAPVSLPSALETLAAAGPDIVFAPADPVIVPAASGS
jgi:hypothetical protein